MGRRTFLWPNVGLVSVLAAIAVTTSAFAQQLDDGCNVNAKCLAREATRNIEQVKQEKLQSYIVSLADLQLFDVAHRAIERIDRSNNAGQFAWKRAINDVAVFEVAAKALNSPNEIASLTPVEGLVEQPPLSTQCWFIATAIIRRSLLTARDTIIENALRPTANASNATLNYLLSLRWPQEIEKLPKNKQGNDWYELSQVWLDLGNHDRAAQAAARAEETGWIDFQGVDRVYNSTWRSWLRLGNFERALDAANRASDRPTSAFFKLQIARALIDADRPGNALDVITAALADVRLEQNLTRRIQVLREVVDLRIAAGDAPAAHAVAEEMDTLAHQRNIIPSGQLATAAAALNDLSEHARASLLLKEAITRLPRADEQIGTGVILGPITGATLGLKESLISQIGVELYRSGSVVAFNEQLRRLDDAHRKRTWQDLCEAAHLGQWKRPSEADCVDGGGEVLFVRWAAEAIGRRDFDTAEEFLKRATTAKVQLLDVARLAAVINRPSISNAALIAAAEIADRLTDPGDREVELAALADARREALPTAE